MKFSKIQSILKVHHQFLTDDGKLYSFSASHECTLPEALSALRGIEEELIKAIALEEVKNKEVKEEVSTQPTETAKKEEKKVEQKEDKS